MSQSQSYCPECPLCGEAVYDLGEHVRSTSECREQIEKTLTRARKSSSPGALDREVSKR